MSLNTLDSYFGLGGKRKADDKLSEETSAKKQKNPVIARDKWNSKWDKAFPWAEKHDVDGQLPAICAWCRDSKKGNSMATCGSPNLQGSTFSKHEISKEHLLAAAAHNAKQRKETVPLVIFFGQNQKNEKAMKCQNDSSSPVNINMLAKN